MLIENTSSYMSHTGLYISVCYSQAFGSWVTGDGELITATL